MATIKILFRGQTRRKGEKASISGKPLPGIWVTGGIFPQNKGYERAIIYTQDPKVEKHVVYAETVGQYTGVDDVLETPVFEDGIITFWQRTDTKHLQRYKGIVKYDGGDRIMVEDELRQDALSVFDEYDIDAEEV